MLWDELGFGEEEGKEEGDELEEEGKRDYWPD